MGAPLLRANWGVQVSVKPNGTEVTAAIVPAHERTTDLTDAGVVAGHRAVHAFNVLQEHVQEHVPELRDGRAGRAPSWMLASNTCFLLGFTVFCWYFGQSTAKFMRSAGSIHPVIWVLISGLVVQYIAQVFHWLHLWKYSYDGSGIKALEVLSEIMFMLSQVLQTSLLILIALGYTLLQSRMGELDLMIPMCFMIGVIHVMLVGFGKIKDDASYKYHENEGAVGYILLAIRLGLYLWFLWAVNSSSNAGGMKLRSFLMQFRLAGTIY
ncbi:unnamed protein product, partial [Prorocentrum cordatum]